MAESEDTARMTERMFPELCKASEVKELLEGILSCIENPETKYPEVIDYTYHSIKDFLDDN